MSDRSSHDALPHDLPKEIRSKLLAFEKHAEIREYKYGKLPADKKRIRVLRLLPGVLDNPQIDCEMFEAEFDEEHHLVHLDNAPMTTPKAKQLSKKTPRGKAATRKGKEVSKRDFPKENNDTGGQSKDKTKKPRKKRPIQYEALSWRWGDEAKGPYSIMIKQGGVLYKKRVSETLGLALKYLRFERERILWIDAICINQEDHDERSSQVAMMSLVYTGARQVCVWIGEDDEESTMAIRFIREEINALKNFDRLCTDKQHAKKWQALLVLMQRAWFSRRWVVQEIALAPPGNRLLRTRQDTLARVSNCR